MSRFSFKCHRKAPWLDIPSFISLVANLSRISEALSHTCFTSRLENNRIWAIFKSTEILNVKTFSMMTL